MLIPYVLVVFYVICSILLLNFFAGFGIIGIRFDLEGK